MGAHSECPVNTLTCFSIGQKLYHCLRRWPNIQTTLSRRFVFAGITPVILFAKCSTSKTSAVYIKHPMLVQCWATIDAGPAS